MKIHKNILRALGIFSLAAILPVHAQQQAYPPMQPGYGSPGQPSSEPPSQMQPESRDQAPMPSSGASSAQSQSGSDARSEMESRMKNLPPPAPMSELTAKTENGVSYLCGGIGLDESTQMKQSARDYDLMLTFAARNGSYLADVNVDIADARGKSILQTTCDGPILLVDLPKAGSYRVQAEAGGHTLKRTVQVGAKARGKQVALAWPTQVAGVESRSQMSPEK